MENRDIDAFFARTHLTGQTKRVVHEPNVMWQFSARGFPMFIQTQDTVDRMRIVAFVAEAKDLGAEHLAMLLEANYHSALDVRYALSDGYVVSAFIHPLAELSYRQFVLALYQVINCADTCGTTFSGGTLVFGGVDVEDDHAPLDEDQEAPARDVLAEVVRMIGKE
jgi:hypothetical protein